MSNTLARASKQELMEAALRLTPVTDLIAQAEGVGITLSVEGGQLRIRGPRKSEALGRLLLDRKAEVLAVLTSSRPQEAEASAAIAADASEWDGVRAAAIVAEVNARIEVVLLTTSLANHSARRNVLASECEIVCRLARDRDRFLWQWPQALHRMLQRWAEWDVERDP
jgi:hypothetical protein